MGHCSPVKIFLEFIDEQQNSRLRRAVIWTPRWPDVRPDKKSMHNPSILCLLLCNIKMLNVVALQYRLYEVAYVSNEDFAEDMQNDLKGYIQRVTTWCFWVGLIDRLIFHS